MTQSPFLGMDPYLESPALWPDVHNQLVVIFSEQLVPMLAPKYITELKLRIVRERIEEPPQIEHVEASVALTTHVTPLRMRVPIPVPTRLVTLYIRQRENQQLVAVIELLSPVNKRPGEGRQEYIGKRFTFLSEPIHLIEIDLLRRWSRMPLEGRLPASAYLATICDAYERARYDLRIDYRSPPDPPLEPADTDWAAGLIATHGQ